LDYFSLSGIIFETSHVRVGISGRHYVNSDLMSRQTLGQQLTKMDNRSFCRCIDNSLIGVNTQPGVRSYIYYNPTLIASFHKPGRLLTKKENRRQVTIDLLLPRRIINLP
jgi:hypothetical protein